MPLDLGSPPLTKAGTSANPWECDHDAVDVEVGLAEAVTLRTKTSMAGGAGWRGGNWRWQGKLWPPLARSRVMSAAAPVLFSAKVLGFVGYVAMDASSTQLCPAVAHTMGL